MRKIAATLSQWILLIALALWVGGMMTLILAAPVVFDTIKPVELAGEAMSLVFRRFNGGLVFVCIGLAAAGFLGKWFLDPRRGRARKIEGGLLLAMILCGIYIGALLGPRMQELRKIRMSDPSDTGAVVAFERGHRLSERLFSINLLLGFSLLWMSAREAAGGRTGDADRA